MATKYPRRDFLNKSISSTTMGASLLLTRTSILNGQTNALDKKKIIVFGAHPDDPETMCGGAMALFSEAGHEVIAAYLTRGEAGIPGSSHEEASRLRSAEAENACKILNVHPEFLGQVDGSTEITRQRYSDVLSFIEKENPHLIITHWPIDTHRDHRICSILVYDAWLAQGKKSTLYYGEVMSGIQTQNFCPTDYLDITPVVAKKHAACFAHTSQNIESSYANDHGKMEIFRGMESGYDYAEAFIRHIQSPSIYLS